MSVLITGGAGFIGSSLADKLLKNGYQVICIDNFDPFYPVAMKHENIRLAKLNPDYTLIQGDIRSRADLRKCFVDNTIEMVIHLAAKAGVRPSIKDPQIYFDVNVMGTLNLLELMREYNVKKMIFSSSSSVYGDNTKIPFCEDDLVDNPISPYAASKKAGELVCHTYHHLYDFDIFCLRLFTVYGPRQRPDLAINKFLRAILDGKEIPVYGNGSTERDYTYVDEIVNAIISALPKVKGYEIVNLGNGKPVALTDLILEIEKITGVKAKLHYYPLQPGDVRVTFADITKARDLLNYHPSTPLAKGLQNFMDWISGINPTTSTLGKT
jgi:UDP-glucuronate 4-epimerase